MSETTTSPLVNQMLEAAVHFGHKSSKWNPKMKKYLFAKKEGIHVFDLLKSAELFQKALDFLKISVKEGKNILFVSTKQQAQKLIEKIGQETGMPYISHRWMGGFLTNFETIKKRIKYLNDLKDAEKKGEFEKYTKKEALNLKKKIEKLESSLGGVSNLQRLPDIVFVLDVVRDKIVVKEAAVTGVAVVAIIDSNADPKNITYPIPGNDDALKSITFYLEQIKKVIMEAKGTLLKKSLT